ncbi:hypothetical protein SAMN05892883_3970 [Jatrophihabitans sp. GAS493]|uniref:hypothetical protein n=1 Tax=Jatrophihabitans sp. GAS493 TaxID=1907575 RepID=UPI000BB95863|nr:hypothetical protein [Jatrophihabitans sp. GAS493]SOD74779.1 hypothetical protein SAMN05892883_3970 [Jatrophihabitans sp. GAS493]
MSSFTRTFATLAAAGVAVVSVAGCTSAAKVTPAGGATSSNKPVIPTRWWSDAAGSAGSKIDISNPTAAAAALKPDSKTYCSVLSDTLSSGKSVFSGAASTDPGIATSTKAWIAELTALSPTELHASWNTFGDALTALLVSASKASGAALPKQSQSEQNAVSAATAAIGSQARSVCNVDLFPGVSAAPTSPSSK